VEDERSLLGALVDRFTREKFSVLQAKNGEEGLAIALKEHPDLILLDIIMPVMDGTTMLKKLRVADEWGKYVPVIMLSNLQDNDRIAESLVEGSAQSYMIKANWKIEDVVAKVREQLETPPR